MALIQFILGLLSSVLSRLVVDDFKAWTPRLVRRLIERAVATLPPDHRHRYAEEWQSHANDVPGELGKVFLCLGFLWAARKMAAIDSNTERTTLKTLRRVIELSTGAMVGVYLAPVFVVITCIILSLRKGPIFKSKECVGLNGRTFRLIRFNTQGMFGEFLLKSRMETLPYIVNLLRGDIGIVGPRPCSQRLHHLVLAREQRWKQRCVIRPGILSWTDITAPQNWREELRDDLFYLQNRGAKLDLLILRWAVRKALHWGR
jgi:lipopolysaccharide/colanic/teichoic acid biosynthesis glycosyltransferase